MKGGVTLEVNHVETEVVGCLGSWLGVSKEWQMVDGGRTLYT